MIIPQVFMINPQVFMINPQIFYKTTLSQDSSKSCLFKRFITMYKFELEHYMLYL
jgi:hypothetical protein